MDLSIPLMENNITETDINELIDFLKTNPRLTQSSKVKEFEVKWSEWLGVKHSVFVNSGSSANLLTIAALKHLYGKGEVIVPVITWSSDIASLLHTGMTPVFVDIDPKNLAMAEEDILKKITTKTKAVFLTHILGFNGISKTLLQSLNEKNIPLIEDVCESHGATFQGQKLGSFGLASNFSFYYAHHMSTIEGGMVCTNDSEFYETVRMLRSHGLVREIEDKHLRSEFEANNTDLNPQFIFAHPGFNVRSTELNAVLGLSQLKSLDKNNKKRQENFKLFLDNLDGDIYRKNFDTEGSVNYAFVVVLKDPDEAARDMLEKTLSGAGIEFRRGTSGGGNQLRQPYIKHIVGDNEHLNYPNAEHIHFFGYYIGNYPTLKKSKIKEIAIILNKIKI